MRLKLKKRGQALVEFALFAVLLMMMLSAVIDLGLAFFAHQGLSGAALEGVSYLAIEPNKPGSDNSARLRVQHEAGASTTMQNRARFVDLMDLNNDGVQDDAGVRGAFIQITQRRNTNAPPSVACTPNNRPKDVCDIRVTVRYNFRAKFFMATIFGLENFELRATRQMTVTN